MLYIERKRLQDESIVLLSVDIVNDVVIDWEPSNSLSLYPFYPDTRGYALLRLQGDTYSIPPIVNSPRGLG